VATPDTIGYCPETKCYNVFPMMRSDGKLWDGRGWSVMVDVSRLAIAVAARGVVGDS
jgi:hypothetical protein